jgi:acetyl esterase/lipase
VTSWAVALAVLAGVRLVPTFANWMLGPVVVAGEYGAAVAAAALGVALWAVLGRPGRPAAAGLAMAAALVAGWPVVQARRALADGHAAIHALPATANPAAAPGDTVYEGATRYAAEDGTPLTLRRYRPGTRAGGPAGPRPAVVVLHAGAWRSGDAGQAAAVHRALARRGYAVVALDYRHAPRHRFPAQPADVRRGLALVRDSAAAWGVDPRRVVLWGRSSGGHLALLAAFAPDPLPGLQVRGVVSFYGPVDLAEGYRRPPRPDPIDARAVLTAFLGGAPAAMPERYRAASPIAYAREGLPPALLVYGGRDHVVEARFGRALAAALRRAGSPVVHVELPWAEHGFDFARGGAGARVSDALLAAFLARVP